MATTVIAQAGANPAARPIAWHQLVDLAAQRRGDSEDPSAIYGVLRKWRAGIPVARRKQACDALIGRPIPAALFAFFATDTVQVVQGLALSARFSTAEWRVLLPKLPSPVRALLRHRDDLDAETRHALASFGAADLVIAGPALNGFAKAAVAPPVPRPVPAAEPEMPVLNGAAKAIPAATPAMNGSGVQIRDLVQRIEAYRREKPRQRSEEPEGQPEQRADFFRFETGADGVLIWVEGASRAPLVGISIAATADTPDQGVDGYAAGAFRRRAPFRDARLTVPGVGEASGEWRISAVPFFTPQSGRFTGYRGTARRPRIDEIARNAGAEGLYGSAFRPESLRQLVHELRTPLNAILGFAEMIDGQMLGPAARDYRTRAVDIVGEARRLLGAVDDLDTAARVDSNALRLERARIDGADMLRRICEDLDPLVRERHVALDLKLAEDLPSLSVDPVALERMFSRLLSAVVAVSGAQEKLGVVLAADRSGMIRLSVARPQALRAQEERALLDPGYSPDGDWPDAPLLGLGFALRLVRNLAEAAGGRFTIAKDSFALDLPAMVGRADAGEGSG